MAVEVKVRGEAIEFGAYRKLFQMTPSTTNIPIFTMTPDAQRFIHQILLGEDKPAPVTVVVNWLANLKRSAS